MGYEAKCIVYVIQYICIYPICYYFQSVVVAFEVTSLDKLWNYFILNRKLTTFFVHFVWRVLGGGIKMTGSIFYDY